VTHKTPTQKLFLITKQNAWFAKAKSKVWELFIPAVIELVILKRGARIQ